MLRARETGQRTSDLALLVLMIISTKPIAMKVRTIYPEHPLPENEWYQYIYNLLTQPHEPITSRQESILLNKRRAEQARRFESASRPPTQVDKRGVI